MSPTSPCIDAGTNALSLVSANWSASITNDLDGLARPLDGNGDSLARFDIGAYEVILASADSNGDGIPDGWTQRFGLNPTDPTVATGNSDNDPHTTLEEWIADTDPTDPLSFLRIESVSIAAPIAMTFLSSSNRVYSLERTDDTDNPFFPVDGLENILGNGATQTITDTNPAPTGFYRIRAKLP